MKSSQTALGVLVLALGSSLPALPAAGEDSPAAPADQAAAGAPGKVPFRQPQVIEVGDQPTVLYVQFTEVDVPQENSDGTVTTNRIWTRAYGLEPKTDLIPGPTFRFQPGDFLQLTLDNLLDVEDAPELAQEEAAVDPVFDTDEIAHHVRGEMNIPHNPNNTNLHTHGLHVDPDHDDVTLIVIPKGDDKQNYSPDLWPYIREQIWPYQYRIPDDHLPGTHWYHAHKHGSTSIHVENGMAGAFVLAPRAGEPDLVPGLPAADDLVMVIQEITNYGIQQGAGKSLTKLPNPGKLTLADDDSAGASIAPGDPGTTTSTGQASRLITVNGQVQPTLTVAPGRVQRWRLVNAAANHRSFSYVWLGRLVETDTVQKELTSGKEKGKSVEVTQYTYQEVPLHLAALDGITLEATVPITAAKPLFMGPGNRADVLFQVEQPGRYAMFKNYPASTFDASATTTAPQTEVLIVDAAGRPVAPVATVDSINNPYLLRQESATEANFDGFKVNWLYLDTTTAKPDHVQPQVVVTPLLRLQQAGSFLDLTYPTEFPSEGWQPVDVNDVGGGATDSQLLVSVEVQGQPVTNSKLPSPGHVASVSPTGTMKPPAYVSPITDADVLQSRTALFDLSGVSAIAQPTGDPNEAQTIRQFTLNGRQFDLDDSIGNPDAVEEINDEPDVPAGVSHGTQQLSVDCVEHHGLWVNQHWVNPGYYRGIEEQSVTTTDQFGNQDTHQGYTYEDDHDAVVSGAQTCVPAAGTPKLTYANVTGLDQLAVVNAGYAGHDRVAGVPGLPVATTAEEWVLINNGSAPRGSGTRTRR